MKDDEFIALFKQQEDETMRGAIALAAVLGVLVFIGFMIGAV
jgi:hypothetical protein